MLKVAVCRVKPYELISREEDKVDNFMIKKKVEENLEEQVGDNDEEANKIVIVKNEIGNKYIQLESSVCFLEILSLQRRFQHLTIKGQR